MENSKSPNDCKVIPYNATLISNYRPQTKFAKVMFLQVSVCPQGCVWQGGGHAWLWGACMVVGGGVHGCRGHAWLWGHVWLGGMCSYRGVCMVAGGMHGCRVGMCGGRGACVVSGGHVSLWGACMVMGVCMVVGGMHGGRGMWWQGGCMGYNKIQSMSGLYTSYWNDFLFHNVFAFKANYC